MYGEARGIAMPNLADSLHHDNNPNTVRTMPHATEIIATIGS